MSLPLVPPDSSNERQHRTVIATTVNELIRTKLNFYGSSPSAPVIVNGSTIATFATGAARVAPAGNVTGIILAAGTEGAQVVLVVNASAFTVTFAAAGTSNVADGTSSVISANRCALFVWDVSTARWYRN